MGEELTQRQREKLLLFQGNLGRNSREEFYKSVIANEKQKDVFSKKNVIIRIMVATQTLFYTRSNYMSIDFNEASINNYERVEDCLKLLYVSVPDTIAHERACSILSQFITLDDLRTMSEYNKITSRLDGHKKCYFQAVSYFECNICEYRSIITTSALIYAHMRTHIKKYTNSLGRYIFSPRELSEFVRGKDLKCVLCKKSFTDSGKRNYEIIVQHIYVDHIKISENKGIIQYLTELIEAN